MSAEPIPFEAALGAVTGDDAALFVELRKAFLDGAHQHVAAMEAADGMPALQAAAWRLHGLAASFGATVLMDRAADAGSARAADPRLIRRIHDALDALAG